MKGIRQTATNKEVPKTAIFPKTITPRDACAPCEARHPAPALPARMQIGVSDRSFSSRKPDLDGYDGSPHDQ